jgi:ribonuclease P protein component
MVAKRYTLGRNERLKSRKQIEQLFSNGQRFINPPFRIFYSFQTSKQPDITHPLQAGFGASSRNFKTAVERNRIKRLTKEAYRLQKKEIHDNLKEQNKTLCIFFIYTGKKLPMYAEVYDSIGIALTKLLDINNKIR